jgi:hypothetical protein
MSNLQIFAMLFVFWFLGYQTGRRCEREGKFGWRILL